MQEYDLIVIGAGPGGYPCAIRAAQLGAKVALVEREWLGGTCLNCGCIPTKAIIAGADTFQRIREAEELGITVEGLSFDYSAMAKRKDEVVARLNKGIGQLLKANKVEIFEGAARFTGPRTIEVGLAKGGTESLKAGKIVVATGSISAIPGLLPQSDRIVESRKFLELVELPASLLVMGGGYIGCELACMAAALGVRVTIVEMMDDILMLLDKDVRSVVKKHMRDKLGIEIICGNPLEDVKAGKDGISARIADKRVEAGMLLVATGRVPVTDGLGLDQAGVKTDEKGYVVVDSYSRTSNSSIYAIGDVTGRVQLAHAATSQGIYAAETAFGERERAAESLIPGVIFTMPEVAVVGMTEQEAKQEGIEFGKGKFTFSALGKALASGESEGFAKVLTEAGSDRIIGAQVVGSHATDLIAEMALAIRAEITAGELGRTVHGHPTFAEVWMEAAHAVHGVCIHAPPIRH